MYDISSRRWTAVLVVPSLALKEVSLYGNILLWLLIAGQACAQIEFPAFEEFSIPISPMSSVGETRSICFGDFDHDGYIDLVAANSEFGLVEILLGQGDGTFAAPEIFLGAGRAIEVGDFDGDQNLDLASVDSAGNEVFVLFGNGDGTFQPYVQIEVGNRPWQITAADFNSDGKDDIVTSSRPNGLLSLSLAAENRTFEDASFVDLLVDETRSVVSGDFNGDGNLDVVSGFRNQVGSSGALLLRGTGDGSFLAPEDIAIFIPSVISSDSEAADFNRDGFPDMVHDLSQGETSVLINDGNGAFSNLLFDSDDSLRRLAIEDFNGDGFVDFASAQGNVTFADPESIVGVRFFIGEGNGEFEEVVYEDSESDSRIMHDIAAADFNGDGIVDLACVRARKSIVEVLVLIAQHAPHALIGDINLDGIINLLDVLPFVELLTNARFQMEADINQDGVVDLLDVAPFVDLLAGG